MTAIGKLRHRVHLCTQKDVVIVGTTELKLAREKVLSAWAEIVVKGEGSSLGPKGLALRESIGHNTNYAGTKKRQSNLRTHVITTRYHRDVDVSVFAWIYELRAKSSPRWFKVLKVSNTEASGNEYFMFDCRLMEQGENILEPESTAGGFSPVSGLPEGVRL